MNLDSQQEFSRFEFASTQMCHNFMKISHWNFAINCLTINILSICWNSGRYWQYKTIWQYSYYAMFFLVLMPETNLNNMLIEVDYLLVSLIFVPVSVNFLCTYSYTCYTCDSFNVWLKISFKNYYWLILVPVSYNIL